MNKLKMSLALMALMFPLLVCAGQHIELEVHHNHHKTSGEVIPVEVFIDDFNKELTIKVSQEWEPITIKMKLKEGGVVYKNIYLPSSHSALSISLDTFPPGIYELSISDKNTILIGEFVYEY